MTPQKKKNITLLALIIVVIINVYLIILLSDYRLIILAIVILSFITGLLLFPILQEDGKNHVKTKDLKKQNEISKGGDFKND